MALNGRTASDAVRAPTFVETQGLSTIDYAWVNLQGLEFINDFKFLKILTTQKFNIIVDESTDISAVKSLCICVSNNSVAQKFEESLPGITLQKCICHSLHLVASEACEKIPRYIEDFARKVHSFFKNSSKRIAQYQEFQELCDAKIHKILRPQIINPDDFQTYQLIYDQWRKLPMMKLPDHLKNTESDKFWAELSLSRDIDNTN
ncbi:uncharacterized protein LOC112904172 [Agrilus planipennis]|uniref:Uncharacterized protein LOC112904172 n=1 Tax=Agrilus planipennis TaxID=224129 RepID=A0A7F5QW72_AGRPL|nr:uncharacterized protein LOC112904172 [Agrilus planipennis]